MRFSAVILLSTAILLLSNSGNHQATAQVSVPGRFRPHHYTLANSDSNAKPLIPLYKPYLRWPSQEQDHAQGPLPVDEAEMMPVLQMPHLDNAQLLNDEEIARAQLMAQGGMDDGSYRFGKAVAMETLSFGGTLAGGRWTHLKKPQSSTFGNYDDDDNEEDDVMVWQLEIYSKSALSLNLIFSDFYLPPHSEFYVVGKNNRLLGAFTAEINNKPDRVFATAPLAGDRLLLEFYIPRRDFVQGIRPSIELSHVIHGYKPTLLAASSDMTAKGFRMPDGSIAPRERRPRRHGRGGGLREQSYANPLSEWSQHSVSTDVGDDNDARNDEPVQAMSGKCNIDVACHQNEYHDQSRSVGAILSEYNQKYCSGALINNVRQDGRQLFLTANHCTGFSDTSAHLVMFNHEKTQCGSSTEEINEHDTAMGLIKLGNYVDSDYTLYEIVENIPDAYNLYLSGWSALKDPPSSRLRHPVQEPEEEEEEEEEEEIKSPWRTARHKHGKKDPVPTPQDPSLTKIPVVGIHHPSGDSKKISFFYNGSLPRACWSECQPSEMFHWQIPRWDQGTTEPGSSGSPLFDADKRIVGQLHGGSASCWNRNGYDAYGAIHASFSAPPKAKNRLSTYLDPDNTGAMFLDGYGLEQARREWKAHHGSTSASTPLDNDDEGGMIRHLGRPGLEKPLLHDVDRSHPRRLPHSSHRHQHPHHRHVPHDAFHLRRLMNKLWRGYFQDSSTDTNHDENESRIETVIIVEENIV
ncbi:hypothetical protein FBU30_010655 [Linnemannia zychae]|nr:hypothetical protein FBU30_010655 [Linnemannia zychae]